MTYSFDKADRQASLTDWANRITSYGYFPDSHVQRVAHVNGTTTAMTQDNALRLTQVWHQQSTGTTIGQHSYLLDAVGNRTQLNETLAQVGGTPITSSTAYSYDRLYRLTGDGTRTYAYDRADRVSAAGSVAHTVNAVGNVTARGSDTFAYDQANRLTSATVNGTATTFVYDGDGKSTSGGVTTSYAYDVTAGLPVVLTDGSHKYVYGLGLAYEVDTAGVVTVQHADGLGSMRAITDATGAVVQTYQTDPFGVPTASTGTCRCIVRGTIASRCPHDSASINKRAEDERTWARRRMECCTAYGRKKCLSQQHRRLG